ncbi:MAG: hypothetical protein HND55_00770 [Pseudomonadota bacterium]|nr:MAG: hypothetical protein HND55_00770 [Pseudomonadota bacterium]
MTTDSHDIPSLLEMLREGTEHLTNMAKKLEFPWEGETQDPRRLHNVYARNLITCYVSKFSDLSNGILEAVEGSNFLTYALCGRSLIETTATLRYYIHHEYKPLLDTGELGPDEMRKLVEIDDRHLRGTRFDWESFLFRNYAKIKEDAMAHLDAKRKKKIPSAAQESTSRPQVNVLTCVERWAEQSPEVLLGYNLFCDLVHPNIGSNFLVASTSPDGLFFSRFRGEPVGRQIFEQSLPILLSMTHKPFGPLLTMLMGTIWQDDEL